MGRTPLLRELTLHGPAPTEWVDETVQILSPSLLRLHLSGSDHQPWCGYRGNGTSTPARIGEAATNLTKLCLSGIMKGGVHTTHYTVI